MLDHKYLTPAHLKGFDNYKYSAIDTSPLSNYVMHPAWNTIVKFIPRWVAPNLITFSGFLCMVVVVALQTVYDYECFSSGRPPGHQGIGEGHEMPNWAFTVSGILVFLAYNLDGIDGKQARKIGVSGPLGELFDHGLDSYIVFLVPFCFFSVFGRDEFSVPSFRAFLLVMSIVLNFYVSHWEKYNTGTLYLPWGYDVSMWAASLLFVVAGAYGPAVYKTYVFGHVTFLQVLEVAVHATGLFTTLPVAVYNVYLSRKKRSGEARSLVETIRPVWSILTMTTVMTVWAIKSPNDIVEYDPRAFLFLFGTLFSNIASRLIVSEMSGQRCEVVCSLFWPLVTNVIVSFYQPQLEVAILYALTVCCVMAHVHYGICVVRQICDHFRISCFTVPKSKRK